MIRLVDFHSHVLPGIDDGSSSVEESIAMLRMEAEQGIECVVATPHFYANHDTPERFIRRRNEAEARLREEMAKYDDMPQLEIGAEVYYFSGISNSDVLKGLTYYKKRCILIEMPHPPWTQRMYRELEDIRAKQGLIPIIAHIDRYISPLRTYGIPKRLNEMGFYVQANASFFNHRSTRSLAIRLLKNDQIHLLGSDCHNTTSRAPNLRTAADIIQSRLGKGTLGRIRLYEQELLGG